MNNQTLNHLEKIRLEVRNEKLTTLLNEALQELSVAAMTPKSRIKPGLLFKIKRELFANKAATPPTV